MLYILVESSAAEVLMARLLQSEQQAELVKVRFYVQPSSLYSVAGTLVSVREEPVAVVRDAESTYPRVVDRQRLAAEEQIGLATWRAPLRILVAVPALESLLFRRPDAVARAYGPVPQSLLELGLISPRDAFQKLDPNVPVDQVSLKLVQALDDTDIAALRGESPVRELLEFVEELQRDGVLATAAVAP